MTEQNNQESVMLSKAEKKEETRREKVISTSLFKKRWRKFKSLWRGYYSFLLIVFLYIISFFLPFFINKDALVVKYDGDFYFPVFKYYEATFFGQDRQGEANYSQLKKQLQEDASINWVLMPLYPYHPNENLLDEMSGSPPHTPSFQHIMGTDDRARDVFSRLVYGFNISISFALVVIAFAYTVGIAIGAMLGFFGGLFDITVQRLIEIWSTLPFLYVMIILSSIVQPNFILLTLILTAFGWMGITYYIRGEFYREKPVIMFLRQLQWAPKTGK